MADMIAATWSVSVDQQLVSYRQLQPSVTVTACDHTQAETELATWQYSAASRLKLNCAPYVSETNGMIAQGYFIVSEKKKKSRN